MESDGEKKGKRQGKRRNDLKRGQKEQIRATEEQMKRSENTSAQA